MDKNVEVAVDVLESSSEGKKAAAETLDSPVKSDAGGLEALSAMCSDFTEYFDIDLLSEKKQLHNTIEELLTRIEEFSALIDMVKSDTTLSFEDTASRILAKQGEMCKIFNQIDQLEMFIKIVSRNLEQLEEHIDKAESDFGSFSSVKKLLSSVPLPSFFSKKSTSSASKQPPKDFSTYEAPEIFHTEEYFSIQNAAYTCDEKFSQTYFKLSDELQVRGEVSSGEKEMQQEVNTDVAELATESESENFAETVKDSQQSVSESSEQPAGDLDEENLNAQ